MAKKKPARDKELMKIARQLRSAFERRTLGSYKAVFELFPDMEPVWPQLLAARDKAQALKVKPTEDGMREAQRLLRQLRGHAYGLKQDLQATVRRIDDSASEIRNRGMVSGAGALPTLTDCYEQLAALKREYGTCVFDEQTRAIKVASHEVQLESVFFGRYYICIELECLATNNRGFYHVEPVQPGACPTAEGSTHPHLSSSGGLCEGIGEGAMTKAFNDGRLYDCCTLINSILQTYGEHPYVPLSRFGSDGNSDDGEGDACYRCGVAVSDDTSIGCEQCGELSCRGCAVHCDEADIWVCNECRGRAQNRLRSCVEGCNSIGSESCEVKVNEPCPDCGEVCSDSESIQCSAVVLAADDERLCVDCAKVRAADRTPCDSCLMHGYLGCALIEYGYPTLNSLNHPAYVRVRGRRHSHHNFGLHSARLFHSGQTDGVARSDFQAYILHLNRGARLHPDVPDTPRAQRRGRPTMSHRQRTAIADTAEESNV